MKRIVGIIGLGGMGSGLAHRLISSEFQVIGYDIDRNVKNHIDKEIVLVEMLEDLLARCNRIIYSLPSTIEVKEISEAVLQFCGSAVTVIDTGTTDPVVTREIWEKFSKAGLSFLDAPVSGREKKARDGKLCVMIGGSSAEFRANEDVFSTIASSVFHLGDAGAGQFAKLLNNTLYNVNCAMTAEIFSLVDATEINREAFIEVIKKSTGQNHAFDFFSPLILNENFEPGGDLGAGLSIERAYKDIETLLETSARLRIPIPISAAMANVFQLALLMGLGNRSKGALFLLGQPQTFIHK